MGARKNQRNEEEWVAFGQRIKQLNADLKAIMSDAEKIMTREEIQPLESARNCIHKASNRMLRRADSVFSSVTPLHWFFGDVD
jgi:hypothetical protein